MEYENVYGGVAMRGGVNELKIQRDRLYPTADVAEFFNVKVGTIRDWIKRKRLDAVKVGNRYFVKGDKIVELLEKN